MLSLGAVPAAAGRLLQAKYVAFEAMVTGLRENCPRSTRGERA